MSETLPSEQTFRSRRITQALQSVEEERNWDAMEPPTRVPGTARVALVNLDDGSKHVLHECFAKYGIETTAIISDSGEFLNEEKFQGCVLKLHSTSAAILEAARGSLLNRHIMVYGISSNAIALIRFQKYGINAILDSPLDPGAVLEVVKSTQALLKNQMRRYVRIPLMTLVQLNVDRETLAVNSRQISQAGMSLSTKHKLAMGQNGRVTFTLPNMLQVTTDVAVCWVQEGKSMVGVRFESSSEGSKVVKSWMEEYLTIA